MACNREMYKKNPKQSPNRRRKKCDSFSAEDFRMLTAHCDLLALSLLRMTEKSTSGPSRTQQR